MSFSFCIRVLRHGWCEENPEKLWLFYKTNRKIAFVSLCCDRKMNDAISTGKIPENTWLTRHFSGWNDVIHTSITVQRHSSNFLLVTTYGYGVASHAQFEYTAWEIRVVIIYKHHATKQSLSWKKTKFMVWICKNKIFITGHQSLWIRTLLNLLLNIFSTDSIGVLKSLIW